MGLMLSVLVTCVGVIELITFYNNISRHLTNPPQRGDLTVVSDRYIHELRGIRKRIAEDLKKYQDEPPTLCLNSHEDVEIEYSKELQKSRSSSPRRFLVTEKDEFQRESNSPRKFLVSEEPNGLKRSKSQDSIPEFLIHEEQHFEKASRKPRYVLQEKPNEASSSPLPRQFIVSEECLNTVVFEDTDFEVPEVSASHENSPSPFLTIEPPQAPRNSICNELDARIEEEEEVLKSFPPYPCEKVDIILENTNYNTTQYWTNKMLVIPSRKGKSRSMSPDLSSSKANDSSELEGNNVENNEWVKYDQKYLNELDGVNKAKSIKRFGASRKSIKRKTTEQKQNSIVPNALDTTTILTHAAEELQKVLPEVKEKTSDASTSRDNGPKAGEPFWVNN